MRVLVLFSLLAFGSSTLAGQSFLQKQIQHVTVAASADAGAVVAGNVATLWADVTPHPGVHVYAAGAKDFTPVALAIAPGTGVQISPAKYPASERRLALDPTSDAPAYYGPFRITQAVRVPASAKPGETLTVAGTLTYQACEAAVCYPVSSLPVTWTLQVR